MKRKELPPIDILRRLFSYDPATGVITRQLKTAPNTSVGAIATGTPKDGRRKIRIADHNYLLSRLAWKLHYGVDPVNAISYVNGDASDDRITNLWDLPLAEVRRNRRRIALQQGVARIVALQQRVEQ